MSPAAFQFAREYGYEAVCSAYGGYNFPGDDPFHIQRIFPDNMLRLKNWLTVDPRKTHHPYRYDYRLRGSAGAGRGDGLGERDFAFRPDNAESISTRADRRMISPIVVTTSDEWRPFAAPAVGVGRRRCFARRPTKCRIADVRAVAPQWRTDTLAPKPGDSCWCCRSCND